MEGRGHRLKAEQSIKWHSFWNTHSYISHLEIKVPSTSFSVVQKAHLKNTLTSLNIKNYEKQLILS